MVSVVGLRLRFGWLGIPYRVPKGEGLPHGHPDQPHPPGPPLNVPLWGEGRMASERGNPASRTLWIPAFAGMTGVGAGMAGVDAGVTG